MHFLDRECELAALDRAWRSERAELVILYGRRRVGKSELLAHFLRDKPHVYYVGTRKVERDLLAEFTEQIHRLTRDEFLLHQPFQSWDAALSYLAGRAGNRRLVLALDEFPYLCESSRALPSVIQRWWDQTARHLPIVLVGECKWTEAWVKVGDLNELKRKASLLGAGSDVRYVLFSRRGFDPNLIAAANAEGVLLYTVADLYSHQTG